MLTFPESGEMPEKEDLGEDQQIPVEPVSTGKNEEAGHYTLTSCTPLYVRCLVFTV